MNSVAPIRPLLGRCVRDFGLVLLIGVVGAAPIVAILEWQESRALAGPRSHTIEAELRKVPSDHEALRRWLESRDGAEEVSLTETGEGLRITLRCRTEKPLKPPWDDLGYESAQVSSSVIGNVVFRYGWGYHLFVMSRTSVVGAMIIAWRRRRRWSPESRRSSVSVPRAIAIGTAGGLALSAVLGGGVALLTAVGSAAGLFGVWSLISLWSEPAQVFGCIVGPIAFAIGSEWFYRGTIHESFLRTGHARLGAVVSTALFVASQFTIGLSLIPPLLLSLVTTAIYRRTRSLPAVITIHAIVLAAILVGSALAGSPLSSM